jgi:hypothetical protein
LISADPFRSFLAVPLARCQFCGTTEPLFGPRGDYLSTNLPARGWLPREDRGRVFWVCPECRPIHQALHRTAAALRRPPQVPAP